MYTRACTADVQTKILNAFTLLSGHLRLIIATSSFAMGIDCADIQWIIHWSAPADLETYAQETGRADRDGMQSEAFLYYSTGNNKMRSYGLYVVVTFCLRIFCFTVILFMNHCVNAVTYV